MGAPAMREGDSSDLLIPVLVQWPCAELIEEHFAVPYPHSKAREGSNCSTSIESGKH